MPVMELKKWYGCAYEVNDTVYNELRLGRQYHRLMKTHVQAVQGADSVAGLYGSVVLKMFNSWTEYSNKDKLCDFVKRFCMDLITSPSRENLLNSTFVGKRKEIPLRAGQKQKKFTTRASNGIFHVAFQHPLPLK